MTFFRADDRIVLAGDPVTGWGRDRSDPGSLGHGYAMVVAALLGARRPELGLTVHNRGVGGDTTRMLRERWDTDVLALEPTVVSVLVGINDTWRRYDSGSPASIESFEQDYRAILDATRAAGDVRLVLVEPFLAPVSAEQEPWWEDLAPRIAVVRRLAAEVGARLVPAAGLFTGAGAGAASTPQQWCADGVHPTVAGHGLLAQAWLDAVDAADAADANDCGHADPPDSVAATT